MFGLDTLVAVGRSAEVGSPAVVAADNPAAAGVVEAHTPSAPAAASHFAPQIVSDQEAVDLVAAQ